MVLRHGECIRHDRGLHTPRFGGGWVSADIGRAGVAGSLAHNNTKFHVPGAIAPTILANGVSIGGENALIHVFWVPAQNNWRCWDEFPVEFQDKMGVLMKESIFPNPAQRRAWAAITRQPGQRIDANRCVASIILSRGSKRGSCKWTMSENDSQSACDICIVKKRPCMRIARVPGITDTVIVWSPLPERLRRGVEPGNMDYYVAP
ncbi:hypothetical protein J3E72DRAFT_292884 [Bipolaris maydis]|nr:hypothetical protein J3E72DRAFT_292884 [Bipolaris maydis]